MGSHFFGQVLGNVGNSLKNPWSFKDAAGTMGLQGKNFGAYNSGGVAPSPYYGQAASIAGANAGYGTNNLAGGQTYRAPAAAPTYSAGATPGLGTQIAGK